MATFHHLAAVDTPDGPMPTYLAYPEGPGPFPAVAIISGQPGPSTPEFLAAERLVEGCAEGRVPLARERSPPRMCGRGFGG